MSDQTNIVIFKPGRDFSAIHIALDPIKSGLDAAEEAILVWDMLADKYPDRYGENPGHLVEAAKAAGATEAAPAPAPQQQPPAAAPAQPQRAPQQQRQGGGGQFQGRTARFPVVEGWQCDVCNGAVGRKAMTGGMSSDSAVCLGTCKDGKYVHTVGWLDNEAPQTTVPLPQGMPDGPAIDPEILPFHHPPSLDRW